MGCDELCEGGFVILVVVVWVGEYFDCVNCVDVYFCWFLEVDVGVEWVDCSWWCDVVGFDIVVYVDVVFFVVLFGFCFVGWEVSLVGFCYGCI